MKPKLTIYKVLNKTFIVLDIKKHRKIPIYYKWDKKRFPDVNNLPFIVVDYNDKMREWYTYYVSETEIKSCTIDDITGTASILFNDIN